MAEYTKNLNLEKPSGNDNFLRQVLNDNMDKIDQKLGNVLGEVHVHDGTTGNGKQISYNNLQDRPEAMRPTTHKSSHAKGGSDTLLPIDIGAAEQVKFDTHLADYAKLKSDVETSTTASNIIEKVKAVDGHCSGLDADTIDGYHKTEILFYQSSRDFTKGTLIKTDIDYSVQNGEPFLLEIEGNSYGSCVPFDIKVQGYIYDNTLINVGGISNGTNINGLCAFNFIGNLCFWFPTQAYWQGFSVFINTSVEGTRRNRLVSIIDSEKPVGITKEVLFSIQQSFHSGNDGHNSGLDADLLDGNHASVFVTQTDLSSHYADYVRQPGYATATGTANTYAISLSPIPIGYIDGMAICVKINVASTGASTINVNGLGAKAILDSLGNPITAGGLKANTPYTLRYNGTNFIVQGKGGGGNATASDLIAGKTATVDSGQITGTIPNRDYAWHAPVIAVGRTGGIYVAPPQGYYSGSSDYGAHGGVDLQDANFTSKNLLAGKTYFGYAGGIPDRTTNPAYNPATTITTNGSGRVYLMPPIGYYNENGNSWVYRDDPNFVASNIKSGVGLFGVTGTYTFPTYAAGEIILYQEWSVPVSYTSSLTKMYEWTVGTTVTSARFSYRLNGCSSGGENPTYTYSGAQVYKNDSPLGTAHTGVLAQIDIVEDVGPFYAGDKMQFYAYGVNCLNFSVKINGDTPFRLWRK